jgi:hypothetical protein
MAHLEPQHVCLLALYLFLKEMSMYILIMVLRFIHASLRYLPK